MTVSSKTSRSEWAVELRSKVGLTDLYRYSVVFTVLPILAMIITALRLVYRARRNHLGKDDAWAALSIVSAIVMVTGNWTLSDEPGEYPSLSIVHPFLIVFNFLYSGVGPIVESARMRVVGYYLSASAFTSVIWCAQPIVYAKWHSKPPSVSFFTGLLASASYMLSCGSFLR